MTYSETQSVSAFTFEEISRNPVYTDTFDEKDPEKIAHIDLADWADIAIIAPATANIIAKMANGIADDMISTTLLATQATIYIAPAMNVHMYAHPAVIKNMKRLEDWGYHFIEPGSGYLACGYVGKGRLEEPQTIIDTIDRHQSKSTLFSGKRFLISAGPTREQIDPVRFFRNRCSGKMGDAIAETATTMAAYVKIIAGAVGMDSNLPQLCQTGVTTVQDMYVVKHEAFTNTDVLIKEAGVTHSRPKQVYNEKMKKITREFHV